MPYTVFLAHSGADLPIVRAIQDAAKPLGVAVYAFEDDLTPGARLPDKLRTRIRGANAVIALLTEEAVASPAVNQEIGVALEAGKLVIPLIEETVDPTKLTLLQGLEHLSLDRSDPMGTLEKLWPQLLRLKKRHESEQLCRLVLAGLVIWAMKGD